MTERRAEALRRVRGLYGIANGVVGGEDPIGIAADLLDGGCRLVQVRCKGFAPDEVLRVSRAIVARCRPLGAVALVNDDPAIAAAAGADGVHLGQLDGPTATARAILGPDALIGRSTGDLDAIALAVGEVDYVAFGPVFETPNLSRPKPVRGLDALEAARRRVPRSVPLVAIGGIVPERLADVKRAGADAWAVIGAVTEVRGAARARVVRALLEFPLDRSDRSGLE